MVNGIDSIPTEALEDVAYLSRSANRVRILDALTTGPYSRRELTELTETSRMTLDRIVNELEECGWAERTTDGDYVGTPAGTHLMGTKEREVVAARRDGMTRARRRTRRQHQGMCVR